MTKDESFWELFNENPFNVFPMRLSVLDRLKIIFDDFFLEKAFSYYLKEHNDYLEKYFDGQRGNMNFIDNFLEYTKAAESPTSFLRWAAIATLGAVMRDNVLIMADGNRPVYPNLYVILVARSAACRKGFPLKASMSLVRKINNTKIIAGRTSIQAIVTELAKNYTSHQPGEKAYMIQGASGFLYSEELAAFMVEDKATIPLLTELYDYHEEWQNTLKTADTERLKNVCLSLLSASNEHFLKEVYNSNAIYGGLLGRTIIVYEQKRRQVNAGLRQTQVSVTADQLVSHLRRLAGLKGVAIFDEEAIELYEEWYKNIPDEWYDTKSGVEARVHTTVLKVALCLAAADENFNLVIKARHVKEALELCLNNLQNYKFLTMGAGTSRISAPGTLVMASLIGANNFQLSRAKILQKNWGELDAAVLDQVINTMIEAKLVTIVSGGRDGIEYRLTEKCIETYRQTAERKGKVV